MRESTIQVETAPGAGPGSLIVWDTKEQRDRFARFVKRTQQRYPDAQSIAAAIDAFLRELELNVGVPL
jgi:hypothetical protein